jgi:hypothetical protein
VKEKTDSIDWVQLSHPIPFHWPGYMWIWNDRLTADQTTAQIRDMAEHNAFTPMVVPEPKAFRPRNMPTRLEPEYLSQAYFEQYRTMVTAAAESHMNVWLYDEGGWPSGSVCGELVRLNPQLAGQRLVKKSLWVWKGKTIKIPTDCIAANLYQAKSMTQLQFIKTLLPGNTEKIQINLAKIILFTARKTGSYPDLLNPETTRRFIQMTHDQYKKALEPYFGNTISLIFTDEPKIAQKPPWTDGLADDFARTMGYDLRPHLLSLFGGSSDRDMQIRIDFADWWSHRFTTAYFAQIQEWCHSNKILSGGHLNGEDETIGALHHGFGHILRPFRKMDVPGVDVIWRQIWFDKPNHHFPKYAASVAHQKGSPWVLSESFAVYGSGLTPIQMKWIIDYQLVRGVTLFDLAVYQYSNRDWFIGGERPVFGEHNPLWKGMDLLHSYIARLSYLLSCGVPEIHVAIYYPVRDLWANGPTTRITAAAHDALARKLLETQCDFDIIDDDVICSTDTTIESGRLVVGAMKYAMILISANRWMPHGTIKRLREFAQAGGKVFYVRETDVGLQSPLQDEFEVQQSPDLSGFVPKIVQIDPPNPFLRVSKRRLEAGALYFITNENPDDSDSVVIFQENQQPLQIDPETGTCSGCPRAQKSGDGWRIPLHFQFGTSYVFYFTSENLPLANQNEPKNTRNPLMVLETGWRIRKIRSYEIRKPGFHIADEALLSETKPATLGDWRSDIGADFSGDVEYRIEFDCSPEIAERAEILDLGEVKYIAEVTLNGESLGKRIWAPFSFPIGHKLRPGSNVLSVLVSNTLANQYIHQKWHSLWSKSKLGPYHPKALQFEKYSLSSGLFGPVQIK